MARDFHLPNLTYFILYKLKIPFRPACRRFGIGLKICSYCCKSVTQMYKIYFNIVSNCRYLFCWILNKRKGIKSNLIPSIETMQPLSFDNCCLLSCNNFFTLPSLILSKAFIPLVEQMRYKRC